MSVKHPTPWKARKWTNHGSPNTEFWTIEDAKGYMIDGPLDEETVREIVDAVNSASRGVVTVGFQVTESRTVKRPEWEWQIGRGYGGA